MGKIHRNALRPGYLLHWYQIKEILGQGGFGITYLAHDNNLDKDVAIKEYLPIELAVREGDFSVHPVSDEHGKQYKWGLDRFISEARTLAKFEHPNIVRVHSVFEENNSAYMIMAYEKGQSLQQKLAGKKTLEEAELLKIIVPIMGGLEIVHSLGFIHRDIKPDNIYIRNDGSPVLLDFGSARQALGEQTKTLTSLVSPGYAPFEQYFSKSDEQGPWTDIYGMGATLYRAVIGVAPMDAVDRSKSILKTSKDTILSATELVKDRYSERFLKAIDHAIQFKAEERPQTIAEWKAEFGVTGDLAEIKRIETLEQQPTQPGTHVIAKHISSRTRLMTVTLLIVMFAVVVGFYYQEQINAWIQPLLPEATTPELAQLEPTPDEQAQAKQQALLKQQQADEEAKRRAEKEAKQQAELEQKRLEEEAKQQAELEQKHLDEEARTQQGNEIAQLLETARTDFDAGRIIEPPDNNALEKYLKVLEIDPGNSDALSGKKTIFRHFLGTADNLIKAQKFVEADAALIRADAIEPNSVEVRLARIRLKDTQAEAERIALVEERKQLEEEQKRLAEEQKLKTEEEAKQLAELEKQRQEEQRRLEGEKRKAEEEKKRSSSVLAGEMVDIPGGSFRMGDLSGEGYSNEKPVHMVTVSSFRMGKHEVTFDQWDACVMDGGCNGYSPKDAGWGRGSRPVIYVSWDDAQSFVNWLNGKTGGNFRLPSETEWEYAARAGTETKYPWGDQASHEYANYGTDKCCGGLAQGRDRWVNTAPVGQFPANAFGLHDMHGNVWEWTQDCWHDSYNGAPSDGSAWTGGDCSRRLERGGSWNFNPVGVRSASRGRAHTASYRLNFHLGFRLVQGK